MTDASDVVPDWPLLNALLNCASGATWVSLRHSGGMGFSSTPAWLLSPTARTRRRRLTNDSSTGVMRDADAGYEIARECARARGAETADGRRSGKGA